MPGSPTARLRRSLRDNRDPLDVDARSRPRRKSRHRRLSAASSMPSTPGSNRWSSTRRGSSRCPMPARIWSICATPGSGSISSAIGCASAALSTSSRASAASPATRPGSTASEPRPHRGRRSCRLAVVRSGDGRRLAGAAGQRFAGRRSAHDPRSDWRPWRLRQRLPACSTARITSRTPRVRASCSTSFCRPGRARSPRQRNRRGAA